MNHMEMRHPWGKELQRQSAQYGAVPLVQSPSLLQSHPGGKQGSCARGVFEFSLENN